MKNFLTSTLIILGFVLSTSHFLNAKDDNISAQMALVNEAKDGNPKAQTDLALQYLSTKNKKDEIKAYHYLSLAANKKYKEAQYNLALLQLTSENQNIYNPPFARHWLTLSALNGYQPSMEALTILDNHL